MSKLSKAVKEMNKEKNLAKELRKDEVVTNFMNGDSYVINPLDTLKMISASSIFGEPSYYRDSEDKAFRMYSDIKKYLLFSEYENKTTNEVFTEAIDKALDYDFEGTLKWAAELRNNYYMRLNPQVIITRAAIHPKRKEWSESHPGLFNKYNEDIMKRADDAMSQMSYYLYLNSGKSNIPSIIKRSWAKKLSSLSAYEVNKYKNHEIGMINAVRLCHANSDILNELMKNGSVNVPSKDKTWEQYISKYGSNKNSWNYVIDNIFTEELNL